MLTYRTHPVRIHYAAWPLSVRGISYITTCISGPGLLPSQPCSRGSRPWHGTDYPCTTVQTRHGPNCNYSRYPALMSPQSQSPSPRSSCTHTPACRETPPCCALCVSSHTSLDNVYKKKKKKRKTKIAMHKMTARRKINRRYFCLCMEIRTTYFIVSKIFKK